MNRKEMRSYHKADDKLSRLANIIIKLLVVVVMITAFITLFINAPASDSFFTDRIQSDPYSVEF